MRQRALYCTLCARIRPMSRPIPLRSSAIIRRARRLWRQYGVFWLGAIAVGLTAVLYARLIDWGFNVFRAGTAACVGCR